MGQKEDLRAGKGAEGKAEGSQEWEKGGGAELTHDMCMDRKVTVDPINLYS